MGKLGEIMNPNIKLEPEIIVSSTDQVDVKKTAQNYLNITDWYIIRASEDPSKPVPQDILEKRQEARLRLND